MSTRRGPSKVKRILTGGSFSLTGGGFSTSLIATEASHMQRLVDFIDDKEAFWGPHSSEIPDHVFESVKDVRELAVATQSLCDSVEGAAIAECIATACRKYMRGFKATSDSTVQAAHLEALRKRVRRPVSLALHEYGLPAPKNLDLSSENDVLSAYFSD